MPNRVLWTLALVAVFLFRLGFGLSKELFTEDETQIYLIGLRYHATHHWQYFGPDVVWTQSQIPGGLQALLVGVPLDLVPIPEAPYVLVNLLSMGTLCMFAAYLSGRLPGIPPWLIWGWLLTLPRTLEYSTHILNSAYVLPASLIFFIAFCEAFAPLTTERVRPALAHALLGAAIGWIMQARSHFDACDGRRTAAVVRELRGRAIRRGHGRRPGLCLSRGTLVDGACDHPRLGRG